MTNKVYAGVFERISGKKKALGFGETAKEVESIKNSILESETQGLLRWYSQETEPEEQEEITEETTYALALSIRDTLNINKIEIVKSPE